MEYNEFVSAKLGTVAANGIAVMFGDLRDQLHYALAAHRAATEAHNHG